MGRVHGWGTSRMNPSGFRSLEAVVADGHFPKVDVSLRDGRHVGRDDGTVYEYLVDALDFLEPFYQRFGYDLVHRSEGYFYFLPSGDRGSRRHLSHGEMLVGQTLALMYLDPTTLQQGGVVQRERLLEVLGGLVAIEALALILTPRRKTFDERIAGEAVRAKVAEALRRLATLGFVDAVDDKLLRLRPALMRFADPVRGVGDQHAALARLIQSGEIADAGADPDVEEETDGTPTARESDG